MAGVLCSQYSKAARSSDILYHQASQWLLGYVSGMNAAMKVAKGTTPLATFTNDQVLKSTGAYCDANPASNLANAANEWYATVPKQTDPTAVVKDPSDNSLTLSLDRAPKKADPQRPAGPHDPRTRGQLYNPACHAQRRAGVSKDRAPKKPSSSRCWTGTKEVQTGPQEL